MYSMLLLDTGPSVPFHRVLISFGAGVIALSTITALQSHSITSPADQPFGNRNLKQLRMYSSRFRYCASLLKFIAYTKKFKLSINFNWCDGIQVRITYMTNNWLRISGNFIYTQTDKKSCPYRQALHLRKGVKIQKGAVLVSYKSNFPSYFTVSIYNKKKETMTSL